MNVRRATPDDGPTLVAWSQSIDDEAIRCAPTVPYPDFDRAADIGASCDVWIAEDGGPLAWVAIRPDDGVVKWLVAPMDAYGADGPVNALLVHVHDVYGTARGRVVNPAVHAGLIHSGCVDGEEGWTFFQPSSP